jgi:ribosomal protein L37AE/L43A
MPDTYPCPACDTGRVPVVAQGIEPLPCPACGWLPAGAARRAARVRPPAPVATVARKRRWWEWWR